ncbi:DNA/RNA non-specific endonuclease [Frigoribacterium sp. ME-P-080]|uniref:DNA/RNA non-specific endonuclease n=1 Tax=Frigoribacterium sp. ME-P-080 TaxID=3040289 RepID=UPI002550F5C6|nr:DNA/RNA non-specific endonuclease [Frigoribacterium sp. ME-P-080]
MATKGSLIAPSEFYGLDIVPESIASAAAGYKTTSTAVTTNAEAVMTDWSGLSASYTAPEGPQLFASMDPVRTDAEAVAGKLSTVADLLETLAESVTAPVARIKELVTEANAFRASVAGGVTLDFYDPDNPLFQASQMSGGGVPIVPEGQGETTIPWNEHTPSVERNNELQSQYNAEIAKIDAARVEFENGVNALRDDLCVAPQTAVTGEQLDLAEDNPWGAQGKGERSCQESVGDGLVEFGTSFVEGTVSLVGFDAANGWKHDWSFAGEAWTGMLTGLGALAITVAFPVAPALANLPDSAVPESLRGLRDNYKQTMDGMVGGIVGTPEQWEEDPVAAGTFAVANVASFFIPGAGQVGAGLKVGSGAARAATLTGRLAEVAEDASHLPKGLSRVEDLVAEFGEHAGGLSKLDDLDGLTDTMAALERMTDVEFSGLTGARKAGETVDFGSLSKLEDFADYGDLGRTAEEARAASATHADASAHAGGGTGSDPAAGAARAADPGSGGTTLLERGDGGGAGDAGRADGAGSSDAGRADGPGTSEAGHADGPGTDEPGRADGPVDGAGATPDRSAGGGHDTDIGELDLSGPDRTPTPTEPTPHATPAVEHHVTVSGSDLPTKEKPFAHGQVLAPDTAYTVPGRGVFSTDATGRIVHVETEYGGKGNLNYDLMQPAADTTYVVGGKHVYVTDHASRTVLAEFDDLQLGDADRSESVQKRIGKEGGVGYEGGHLLANMFGGGGEKINIVPMLREVNRGRGHSFGNLERELRQALTASDGGAADLKVLPEYEGTNTVPTGVQVKIQAHGQPLRQEFYDNVR